MSVTQAEIESILVRLVGDGSSYKKMLNEATRSTESAVNTITASLGMISTAISAISVKSLTDFETELAKVEGLVGVNREQVQQWAGELLTLGPQLGKSAQELASALFYITSAGIKGQKAIDALTASAKASVSGLGTTLTVADAVTSAVNAYAKTNLTASQATDILTAAVREGKLEATGLARVVGRLLPVTAAAKVDFAEVAGAIAAMSRTGANAAEAAVSIQSFIVGMTKESEEGSKKLREVGLSYRDLRDMIKKPGGLIQAIKTLDQSFKGDEKAMATVVPEVRALRGVLNLLSQDAGTVDSVMKGVRASTGDTDKAFGVMTGTLGFQFSQLKSSIMSALISIGSMFLPVVERVNSVILSGLDLWKSLGYEIQSTVVRTIAVTAAFLALRPLLVLPLTGIKGMVAGVVSLGKVLVYVLSNLYSIAAIAKLLVGVFFLWFNPTFILLRTVLSLAAAVLYLVKQSGSLADFWYKVEETIASIFEWMEPILSAVKDLGVVLYEVLVSGLSNIGKEMLAFLENIFGMVDWSALQYGIISAIKSIEFVIVNFGKITKLVFGESKKEGESFFVKLLNWSTVASKAIADITYQYRGILGILGLVTAAFLSVVTVIKLVTFTMAFLHAQFILEKVILAVSIAAWYVWVAAVTTAKAVLTLLISALTALGVSMQVIISVGVVANILLIAAGFVAIKTAILAAISSMETIIDLLMQLPTASGPLAEIGGILGDLGTNLSAVFQAMRYDMNLAFELMVATIKLTISQIKDLWPPLWQFIKDGFSIALDVISQKFANFFTGLIAKFDAHKDFTLSFDRLTGDTSKLEARLKGISDATETVNKAIENNSKFDLTKALTSFDANKVESEATKDAKKIIDGLKQQLQEEEIIKSFTDLATEPLAEVIDTIDEVGKAGAKAGDETKNSYKEATKQIEKFEGAILGSAEAITRQQNYQELLNPSRVGAFGGTFSAAKGLARTGGAVGSPAVVAVDNTGIKEATPSTPATIKENQWNRNLETGQQTMINLMEDMVALLQVMANDPGLEVDEVTL